MKFLVLNHSIKNYTGSEINAIQLCEGLRNVGHFADLGTFVIGLPLKEIYEKKGINCFNLLENTNLDLFYDVIWAHHSPVLNQLIFKNNVQDCKIIFSSLSTIHPLESLPFYYGDIQCFLSHNHVNTEFMVKNGVDEKKIILFPNFAPKFFFDLGKKNNQRILRKIAIISNNKSSEIKELVEKFCEMNYHVDTIGGLGKQVFVDHHLLNNYDLVISIGKTVQYCFALKIPVYVYDHFGGPGYLNKENYDLAKNHNFSGRGFNRFLIAEQIYIEICKGYQTAVENLDYFYQKAQEEFCLETNLKKLQNHLENIPISNFELIRRNFAIVERINDIHTYQLREIISLENQHNNLVTIIQNLNKINNNRLGELLEIRNGLTWKLFFRIERKIKKKFPRSIQKMNSIVDVIIRKYRKRYYSQDDVRDLQNYGFFDERWYKETYPDVINSSYNAIDHFLIFGIKEGRMPNKIFIFSDFYKKYPDIEKKPLRIILDCIKKDILNDLDLNEK